MFFDTNEKSLFHINIFIIKLIWFSPLFLLLRPALYLRKVLTSSCFKHLGQLLKQISWAVGSLFTYLKGWKASLCTDSEGSQITFAFEQWVGWWRWWIFTGECLKEGISLIIHKPVRKWKKRYTSYIFSYEAAKPCCQNLAKWLVWRELQTNIFWVHSCKHP